MKINDLSIPMKIIRVQKFFRDNYDWLMVLFCGLGTIIILGTFVTINVINMYKPQLKDVRCDGCKQLDAYSMDTSFVSSSPVLSSSLKCTSDITFGTSKPIVFKKNGDIYWGEKKITTDKELVNTLRGIILSFSCSKCLIGEE